MVVIRAHVRVAEVEAPAVRIVAAVLRSRTPEVSVPAGVVVTATATVVARWQHGKAVFIRAVAALGLELFSGDILTAYRIY